MAVLERRAWLADVARISAVICLGGCGSSEVVAPPSERRANAPKSEPPPGMKPQENFDPRKRLREKAAKSDPQ